MGGNKGRGGEDEGKPLLQTWASHPLHCTPPHTSPPSLRHAGEHRLLLDAERAERLGKGTNHMAVEKSKKEKKSKKSERVELGRVIGDLARTCGLLWSSSRPAM